MTLNTFACCDGPGCKRKTPVSQHKSRSDSYLSWHNGQRSWEAAQSLHWCSQECRMTYAKGSDLRHLEWLGRQDWHRKRMNAEPAYMDEYVNALKEARKG